MPKVCPLNGCKEKQGMCIHDWLMVAMVVIIVVVLLM